VGSLRLSEEQEKCVQFETEGHLLVKGVPGSGKSTVLVVRAGRVSDENPGQAVKLITYNRALSRYLPQLGAQMGVKVQEVSTFHAWARGIINDLNLSRSRLELKTSDIVKEAIDYVRRNRPHRLLDQDITFWIDEISFIKGRTLLEKTDYLSASRTGRGTEIRVTREDREVIWDVFSRYRDLMKSKDLIEFDDFANILLGNIERIPDKHRVDHLFIDEAQDLQQSQIMAAASLARRSITIGADKGQKIYKTGFTWQDVGINIRGRRTKSLHNSFRSTDQIIKLAISLQKHDPVTRDNEYTLPELSGRQGPMPELWGCRDYKTERERVGSAVAALTIQSPGLTIGILARTWRELYSLKKQINKYGANAFLFNDDGANLSSPGAKLVTYHSAKGLEFDVVFATGVKEGNFPTREGENLSGEDLEEFLSYFRRLLYVGITRAKEALIISYGGERSRFLKDIEVGLYTQK
jgi:superfamily I DNA/RNA helicase